MTLVENIETLLVAGDLRKQTRFTRVLIEYPESLTLPYNLHNGVPRVVGEEHLENIVSYQITAQDTMTAAQLSITAANSVEGIFSDMMLQNELLRIEERYSNDRGVNTGWFIVGSFLIDAINPSASGGDNNISVSGRDAFKLLTFDGLEELFAADRIRVEKRNLSAKVNPHNTPGTFYTFVDGRFNDEEQRWIHTTDWSDQPVPRLFDERNNRRISFSEGSMQVLYGTGEIIIEKEFYEAHRDVGGLGNPPIDANGVSKLQIEYSRFRQPEEEIPGLPVIAITIPTDPPGITDELELTFPASYTPPGTLDPVPFDVDNGMIQNTLVVETGRAKNTRFRIAGVTLSSRKVRVDRNVLTEELVVGDLVRIGESNLVEHFTERLLMLAGFQNIDPEKPFYIAEIEPTSPPLRVPSVEQFDFRHENRTTFQNAFESIRTILPSNLQLFCDEFTQAHQVSVFQRAIAQYSCSDRLSSGTVESTDQELATRVVYRVRDRNPINIASTSNAPLLVTDWIWFNPAMHRPDDEPVVTKLTFFPSTYLANLPRTAPAGERQRAVTLDDRANTGWTLQDESAPQSNTEWLDNLLLFQMSFDKPYTLAEVHVSTKPLFLNVDTSAAQIWQIEYSEDGHFWEVLGDEFSFQNGRVILSSSDFGTAVAQHLRFTLIRPAKFTETDDFIFFSIDNHRIYASISSIGVFVSDVIEGFAELGVNRFDLFTAATGSGSGSGTQFIDLVSEVEPQMVFKKLQAKGFQWLIGSVQPPHRVYVALDSLTPGPVAAGVVAGTGVLILEGELDAQFERDKERRRRLGRRTFVVPDIDEVGYYIVQQQQQLGFTDFKLQDYADAKALEVLAESSREFFPLTVDTIRPDARLRDTLHVDLVRLGFSGDALSREISRSGEGTVQIKATPFRDVSFRTEVPPVTISTTVPAVSTPPPGGNNTTTTSTTTTTTTTTTSPAPTTHTTSTTITQPGGAIAWVP